MASMQDYIATAGSLLIFNFVHQFSYEQRK